VNYGMSSEKRKMIGGNWGESIFRFDDVCKNMNMQHMVNLGNAIREHKPRACLIAGISPFGYELAPFENQERVYPKRFNPVSDHRVFYDIDYCDVPVVPEMFTVASHGLFHIDHRLLTKECQEMSIVSSCRLLKSNIFIPPKNFWNEDTEEICKKWDIVLIKFEEGWKSVEHEDESPGAAQYYYLHSRNVSVAEMKKWLQKKAWLRN
jgi:hypothetical protein